MSDDEKVVESPKKKRRGWMFLVPLVLVLAGAPGAYFWAQHSKASGGSGGDAAKADHSGALPLDPFTVNLADKEASRFLRITISLVVNDAEQLDDLRKDSLKLARVRSELLELLTQQTSDKLVSKEGKDELKRAIAQRAATTLQPLKVTDVLFSDFVVQF
jgi:flagellar FliL protein